jgi:hypothetical protein
MALNEGKNDRWRKFVLPGAVSLVGAGAGLALTKTNKLRDSLPKLDEVGIGDLADDLRSKLRSVVGKGDSHSNDARSSSSRRTLAADELQERLRRREERRKQRAGR